MEYQNGDLKIFYDAEFTAFHRNTTLISIGMYAENGAYFYAEFTDYCESQVTDWIHENVIKHLILNDQAEFDLHAIDNKVLGVPSITIRGNTKYVKRYLHHWLKKLTSVSNSGRIQFFTDCYAYDWVLLNDLICEDGVAINTPEYVNYIPIDLCTIFHLNNIDPDINREEFVGESNIYLISAMDQFASMGDHKKHNALWDATIIYLCYHQLMQRSIRFWDDEKLIEAANSLLKQHPDARVYGTPEHPTSL